MSRILSKLASVAYGGLIFLSVSHSFLTYVANPFICEGPSMLPTIEENDIILCERFSSTLKSMPYKRGDVAVALSKRNPREAVCKRIVALEGDIVQVKDRGIFLIPESHVWLEGDNSSNSHDSRNYGPVHEAMVLGRVIAIMWPPSRARLFLPPKVVDSSLSNSPSESSALN